MAQKKKKSAAGAGAKRRGPYVGLALYNLGGETPKGAAVRAVADQLGIACKTLKPEGLGSSVGAVAGLPGFKHAAKPYEGETSTGEFMLVCGLGTKQLNGLLAALRQADAQVGCKAMVTEHNRLWPLATLIAEVSREHAAMAAAAEGAEGVEGAADPEPADSEPVGQPAE